MRIRLIIALLVAGVIFGGIFGWKYWLGQRMAAQAQQAGQTAASVAAAEVKREHWRPRLQAVGSLVARQGIFVNNEVPGQVAAIQFESGAEVAAGALLLELDSSIEQAELEGLQAERRLAQLEFDRSEELLQEDSLSKADYDASRARLQQVEASIAAKRAEIAKHRITAPFGGRLGIRRVDPGEFLQAGSRIVRLQDLEPIFVDFQVPERQLGRLAPGAEVVVKVQAWPVQPIRGHISALEPALEPATRSLLVRAELPNPQQRLRPGMFAQVEMLLPETREVLTLPRSAITYNPYGDAVFRLQQAENGQLTAHNVPVRTGEVREDRVEILQGLEAGERVVSAGQVKLRDGQTVIIDEAASAAVRGEGEG
jgi:membrane fusion protein (multidrug efflux system)